MHKERNIGIAVEIIGCGFGIGLQNILPDAPLAGWIVIVISTAIGFGLIGYSYGKPEDNTTTVVTTTRVMGRPKKRLTFYDRQAIHEVENRMYKTHKHTDTDTMKSDVLNGELAGNLINGTCSICGRPRNLDDER